MNKNKFGYLILPFIMGGLAAVWASEPIIIDENEANVEASIPVFSSANIDKMIQNSSVQNAQEAQNKLAAQNADTTEEAKNSDKSESTLENNAALESKNSIETEEIQNAEEEITLENSTKSKQKKKKQKKAKDDYSEYLIPNDGYLPVGNTEDKQIYIQGSVSKTEQLSLSDCLELALQNNPKIKAAYANSSAVKENKVQTISNYTPNISTNTGISRIKADPTSSGSSSSSYSKYLLGTISLSQLVYDFGITQNQYTINKLEWEVSKQNIESVVNTVVCDVKDAYYNLLYTISAKQVRQETVEQYEDTYKQAKAFYEIGTKPKVDVTIASANLADARSNYIQASNAVDIAVSKLNNAMGTPFIAPYVVDTSMPLQQTDITMHDAIEIANQARPDLKMAIEQLKMADQSVRLAKKAFAPQISVAADLSMGGRSDFTDKSWYTVGGYFSFPVINPVSLTSQVKQLKAQYEQQKYNTTSSVNDIYYEIQTAYVQLNDARERIVASKIAVQEARESYEQSQGRYKAGVCDAIELKESQITYENAKLAYISNIYTYNSAKASLEKAIGQSVKVSDVQENVEI
ncbi:MAG: TolC family protein [Candidatus Gastranaerophilales bacterium]|nr:TolC family protein [Candidatus Gastranaerophilales bacterium]